MADRISKLVKRVGIKEGVAITGGVAKNFAVVQSLIEVLGVEFVSLGEVDPQIVGALGAALFAKERAKRESEKGQIEEKCLDKKSGNG